MVLEGVQNFLRGGGTLDVEGIGGTLLNSFGFVATIGVYLVVAGGIGWAVYFFTRYNIIVKVKTYEGGRQVNIKDDRAKIVKDKHGKTKLKLFKLRLTTPLPDLRFRYRKRGKPYYEFILDNNQQLHPMLSVFPVTQSTVISKITGKPLVMAKTKAIPQDRIAWLFSENILAEEKIRKKDFFDRYGQMIIHLSSVVFIFLMFFFGFKSLTSIGNSVGSALGAVARACLGP